MESEALRDARERKFPHGERQGRVERGKEERQRGILGVGGLLNNGDVVSSAKYLGFFSYGRVLGIVKIAGVRG